MSEEKQARKTLTLDADALDALIEAKVQARLAGQLPSDPLANRMAEAARQLAIDVETFECESPMSGARFTMVVNRSRTFPLGRCMTVENYVYPPGCDKHVCDGGLVPDGMQIHEQDERGRTLDSFSVQYKMWRSKTYYIADLTAFVGKPYQPYFSVEEADRRRAVQAAQLAAQARP